MNYWKITGFIATVIIVLTFPAYLLLQSAYDHEEDLLSQSTAQFVGGESCIECHKLEFDLWKGSDHDKAMEPATEMTVLGDFNNAEFEQGGLIHKFYKRDSKYFVYTDGTDGEMTEFEVHYTFGVRPLQQYLVPLEGGRLQTLALTWDTEKNEWYHMADTVYSGQIVDHTNWLHWTNQGQNWNGMCADCHSTNLQKNYDFQTDVYTTSWTDIDVNCEACHGPGSLHNEWAKLPEMARPMDDNYGLVVKSSNIDNIQYVNLCVRCHSRRSALHDYDFTWHDQLDHMIPQLVREPFYFPDGQILEEDYVYASFVQSKMYMNDVQCNDCHNVHSLKLVKEGNSLCLQCHRADVYDTYDHHFHKYEGEEGSPVILEDGEKRYEVGEGALCINCHMPGRYYMGVDYRRDHSFRVPRPDLSDELSTPNACNQCHSDKTSQWAASYLKEWYGKSIKPHYGTILAAGHRSDWDAREKLIDMVEDELYPVIIRASAISLLGEYYPNQSSKTLKRALYDPEALIRQTAINSISLLADSVVELLIPLLNDYVKAVRMEAASKLSLVPADNFPTRHKPTLNKALEEYRISMEYNADFSSSRFNLGNYYANTGNTDLAVTNYKTAIEIDDQFYPAMVNLAMLYNQLGQNDNAEILLRHVVENHPEVHDASYSLGLLLAEQGKYDEAIEYLQKASMLMPNYARIFYNTGLLLQQMNRLEEAETSLLKALAIEKDNLEFLYALADHYLKRNQYNKAKEYAQQMKDKHPENPIGQDILNYIDSN